MKNERFIFGTNWEKFLRLVDEDKIKDAEESLRIMLAEKDLAGKSFLDAGCGSGLFSLAAKRLGARVFSFDDDPHCVACTLELKKRAYPDSPDWEIRQGSVLDECFLNSLGKYDVVYSWGVLYHTGDMKRAIILMANQVKAHGILFISIANNQGVASQGWLRIKILYNTLPSFLRFFLVLAMASIFETKAFVGRLISGKNPLRKERGMSVWHDWVDWCGGYPFEVAKPEDIIVPLRARGFILENLKTCLSGWGCNEYVFRCMD